MKPDKRNISFLFEEEINISNLCEGENYFFSCKNFIPLKLFSDKNLNNIVLAEESFLVTPLSIRALSLFLLLKIYKRENSIKILHKNKIFFVDQKELKEKNIYHCKNLNKITKILNNHMEEILLENF